MLAPGSTFGPYEIAERIGAGGMGEVYRARDTTLERDVAIKVLPESFASDSGRVARFEQEAKMLASLNHPNIAHIYGLERGDGTAAIVMELVDGPTLADRIAHGPIPAEEALHIAMQLADALEAAHERNIVHRDLKPANVKLRPDGTVKVLDFGIAKAFEPPGAASGSGSPIMTTPATQVGVILGTAAYMAPEQARGKPIDKRADVWAFGCLLYEMLTGQLAFGGEDVAVTLARVIANETDMGSLPGAVSPAVRHTIALCLRKDPGKRIADIRDVKLALAGEFDAGALAGASEATPRSLLRRAVPLAAAGLVGALAIAVVGWFSWPEPRPAPINRFAHVLPQGQGLGFTDWRVFAASPDGRSFAYNGIDGIHIRTMGALEDRVIPGIQPPVIEPFFSPDGQSIGYFNGGEIRRIATTGGASVVIAALGLNIPPGASWTPDDTILYAAPAGIFRVVATGGTPELIVEARDGGLYYGPQLLPDGDTILYGATTGGDNRDTGEIVATSLSTGERTVLARGGSDPRYLPTGHIVYAFGDGLFGLAFDAETLSVSGGAVPLVQGVSRASNGQAAANFAVTNDGTLIYLAGGIAGRGAGLRTLVWVDRDGRQQPVDMPPRSYIYAQLSPDGTRVVLDVRDQENDTWIWDLERETLQRLTFDPARNRGAVWSPDGRRVAFSREIEGSEEIYWQAADGSGVAEALTEGSGVPMFPVEITPDGKTLLYTLSDLPRDTFMVPITGTPAAGTPLIAGPASEGSPIVSPDGRWLAYTSDESGRYEVYVRPFPDVDSGRWQISTAGGMHPHWRRDGGELFYMEEQGNSIAFMAVPTESEDTFRPGSPRKLFEGPYWDGGGDIAGPDVYDVSLDGERFLMLMDAASSLEADEQARIVIVQNWFEELKRLVPTE